MMQHRIPPPTNAAYLAAIDAGNTQAVARLLQAGAPYDTEGDRYTSPPLYAVVMGRLPIIRLFLDAGTDINTREENGGEFYNTLLTLAAIHQQDDAMKLLLELGADPNLRGDGGYTALDILHVEREEYAEAEKLLLSYGAT